MGRMKLILFSNQVKENKFTHFHTLQRILINVSYSAANKYDNILSKVHEEFISQLKDFEKVENEIQLLTCLFSFDVEKLKIIFSRNQLTCRLINGLRDKFISVKCADFFGLLCDSKYSDSKTLERRYKFLHLHTTVNKHVFMFFTEVEQIRFKNMDDMNIWLKFCTFQHQYLHQILVNLSATVNSNICHINLVSTYNESCNLDSYSFFVNSEGT
jgi:hypothetical protein